jgi:hypothetical protein
MVKMAGAFRLLGAWRPIGIALGKRIAGIDETLKNGRWNKKE